MGSPFTNIQQFLNLLQGVTPQGPNKWKAQCPAHDDRDPSLSIRLEDDKIKVKCFAGCDKGDVLKAIGLDWKQLYLDDGSKPRRGPGRPRKDAGPREVVAEYIYTDEHGKRLYRKVRYKPKDFDQHRAEGEAGWVSGPGCMKGVRRVLYRLPEVLAADTVYWTEGEKDADNVRAKLGLTATTVTEGAGGLSDESWQQEYADSLRGKNVVLLPDQDDKGLGHALFIGGKLRGIAASIKLLLLPEGCKDISDWLAEHGKAEWEGDLLPTARDFTDELVAELAEYAAPARQRAIRHDLPNVMVTGRHMRDITTEALKALHDHNNPARIFRRADQLLRISIDEAGKPYADALSEAAFRGELDRCCNFVRLGRDDNMVPLPPPLEIVRDGMTQPTEWQFPPLLGVTESPALRPDGTVLDTPGYDPATRLYYHPAPNLDVPPIPDKPTDPQLQDAKELIIEALADFPFDGYASWCNAIGTMMAPVLRPMIEGPVPMALFDKPQAGTGASLLAEVISVIATGRPAAMMSMPTDEEAWKKSITSILLQAQLVCVLDNCEGDLWAPSLASLLTLTTWRDRILGASKIVELPHRAIWIATGNNLRLRGDLPRRCIWSRMDAQVAQPWLRDLQTFRHPDLRGWVDDARGAILAAILTVAREWTRAGRPVPDATPILGGYESYSRLLGGVLHFMGARHFMANLSQLYDQVDRESPQWAAFLETWHDILGEDAYTAAQLIGCINDNTDLQGALPDALAYIMEKRGHGEVKNYGVRLGQRLANYLGRRYGNNYMLTKNGTLKRAVCWQVVRCSAATTSPNFSLQSEVGEVRPTLREGFNNNNIIDNTYRSRGPQTSLSSPLATKSGEVKAEISPGPEDIGALVDDADLKFICGGCKGTRYWFRKGSTVKVCAVCHPPQGGERIIDSV